MADALSRPPSLGPSNTAAAVPVATTTPNNEPIDFQDLAAEQETSPDTQKLIAGGSLLTIQFQDIGDRKLARDTSTGT